MAKAFTDEDDALLEELGVEVEAKRQGSRTPREERIIAGFEEIQRFVAEHGRAPLHGEDRDIFERLYAVRLDRLRELEEARGLLAPLDHQALLNAEAWQGAPIRDDMGDEELLAELGVDAEAGWCCFVFCELEVPVCSFGVIVDGFFHAGERPKIAAPLFAAWSESVDLRCQHDPGNVVAFRLHRSESCGMDDFCRVFTAVFLCREVGDRGEFRDLSREQ